MSDPEMRPSAEPGSYLLGTSDAELDRLAFQHGLWGPVSEAFLDRLGIGPGMRVLDLGCGPGLLTADLLRRVGPDGHVTALDPSERWHGILRERLAGAPNLELVHARVEEVELPAESFDLVVARWLFCFLEEPGEVLRRLFSALVPGGVVAIQDYNHEGISIFPDSPGFRAAVEATRGWFRDSGGDTWIAPKLPPLFRAAGLEPLQPHSTVLCGGPESDAFRWAELFFGYFAGVYLAEGRLTPEEHAVFEREWRERRDDPDSVFCSPIVMDMAGRKPVAAGPA